MSGTRMSDDQNTAPQPERVHPGDMTVRCVGELEAPHGIQAHHPHPVRHERVLAPFGGKHPAIRMSDDFGSMASEHTGAEMMVRMMVSEDEPLDGLVSDGADRRKELLRVSRACLCVDHDHTGGGHHEAGVRPSLRAATRVSQRGVDSGSKTPDREWRRGRVGAARSDQAPDKKDCEGGAMGTIQEGTKLMLIDCLKVAPLLSLQTIVSGASRSAFRVKLTTGSLLMPDVHSNRATSSPP